MLFYFKFGKYCNEFFINFLPGRGLAKIIQFKDYFAISTCF